MKNDIVYINQRYIKKPMGGITFIALTCGFYLVGVVIGCAYLWLTR